MAGRMWFGNLERMQWVPCPKIEMGTSTNHSVVESDFLNGGAAVRRSATGSRRYEMEWNLTSDQNLDFIESYWEGVWGPGPYYFLDPQAMQTNIFPAAWAQPRVALDDGPKLIFDQKPTEFVGTSVIGASLPNWNGPTTGVQYNVTSTSLIQELTVPLPPGYSISLLCDQVLTADSLMSYSQDGGAWTPFGVTELTAATGGSIVRFAFSGEGNTALLSLLGRVYPAGQPSMVDRFISGKGNSGCEFVQYDRLTYSAALDLIGGAATMREVGAWV